MSKAVRRVPLGWEHPRDPRGVHIPLFDQTFQEAVNEWVRRRYIDYHGSLFQQLKDGDRSPNPDYYRDTWPDDAVLGYALYETVTEGTPETPTFATQAEVIEYLVAHGTYTNPTPYRRAAAELLVTKGSSGGTFMVTDDRLYDLARDGDLV